MNLLKSNTVENNNTCSALHSVASVTMLAAFALLITACDSKDPKVAATSSSSVPVDAVRVRQENVPLVGDWVGTLDGFVNAQIQPQVKRLPCSSELPGRLFGSQGSGSFPN